MADGGQAEELEVYGRMLLGGINGDRLSATAVPENGPIPKGLERSAQGCEARATLGNCANEFSTPTGLYRSRP